MSEDIEVFVLMMVVAGKCHVQLPLCRAQGSLELQTKELLVA